MEWIKANNNLKKVEDEETVDANLIHKPTSKYVKAVFSVEATDAEVSWCYQYLLWY